MLYPCRECGKDVSQSARRCPYCGAKRPMIRTPQHPKGIHKPGLAKTRTGQTLEAIGGAIGLFIIVGLFTDFYGIPDRMARSKYQVTETADSDWTQEKAPDSDVEDIRQEVELYVITPCLIAFLQLDPAYRQADNKAERLHSFRHDPRVQPDIDDTVKRSVAAVKDVPTLEQRLILYEPMLATCSVGAQ